MARTQFVRRPLEGLAAAALAMAAVGVCAPSASAVHDGRNASTEKAPYAVALLTAEGAQLCGGTLVSPTKVLTAAHCVAGLADPTAVTVVAGRTDLSTDAGKTRRVVRVRVHPEFGQGGPLTYDAAVLVLDRALPYRTLPVAGARDNALYKVGRTATVYGWGMREVDVPATRLQRTTLTLAPVADCDPYTFPGDTAATKVCGLAPAANPFTSVCRGDSGGPLVANGKLIGIVSSGNKFCTNEQPISTFTRADAVTKGLGL